LNALNLYVLESSEEKVVVREQNGGETVRTYKKRALRAGDKERTIRLKKYQETEKEKEHH
jgi:hypothetical protein